MGKQENRTSNSMETQTGPIIAQYGITHPVLAELSATNTSGPGRQAYGTASSYSTPGVYGTALYGTKYASSPAEQQVSNSFVPENSQYGTAPSYASYGTAHASGTRKTSPLSQPILKSSV